MSRLDWLSIIIKAESEVLKIEPQSPRALFLLGLIFHEINEIDKAITFYRKAVLSDRDLVGAYYNLGSIFQEKGEPEEAMAYYRKVLDIDPNFADAWNGSGILFYERGQLEEAITYYQKAIEIDPQFVDAYYNLGKALQSKGEPDKAITNYQKALRLNPNSPEVLNNLGYCLQEKGQSAEALRYFQKAVDLDPDFAEAYYNLALYHQDRNLIEKALEHYKKAIELKPYFVGAHWNMACALLLSGNFELGWKEYEWRWKLKGHRGYRISRPRWDGSDISGRTILLHAEQGFGDAIQFVRYAPLVAERGARVILQCPEELAALFKRVHGVEKVIADGGQLPEIDLHCPLLSLPLVFGTTLGNIPVEIPYITADPPVALKWREKLQQDDSRLKIGLVWAGRIKEERERPRSSSLDLFSSLSSINEITFYSLQKGEGAEQAKTPPKGMRLTDFTGDIGDFSDTAAFIENLDLVISIDTAVAHLAGALGKPVWTLVPHVPDWRWLLNRDDSPWYPTMRLFRQPSHGEWGAIIHYIGRELEKLLNR
jgi:tetratricopeptide (TPR) repeat protein